jgi:hypothetical protein
VIKMLRDPACDPDSVSPSPGLPYRRLLRFRMSSGAWAHCAAQAESRPRPAGEIRRSRRFARAQRSSGDRRESPLGYPKPDQQGNQVTEGPMGLYRSRNWQLRWQMRPSTLIAGAGLKMQDRRGLDPSTRFRNRPGYRGDQGSAYFDCRGLRYRVAKDGRVMPALLADRRCCGPLDRHPLQGSHPHRRKSKRPVRASDSFDRRRRTAQRSSSGS